MVVVYAVTGGTVSLVQGSYEYFHYLHEGYNDSVIAILLLSNFFFLSKGVNQDHTIMRI